MKEHTPWQVQHPDGSHRVYVHDAQGTRIAITNSVSRARLIAAAPALLAELKRADAILRGMDPHGLYAQGAGKDISAAIALAEGSRHE